MTPATLPPAREGDSFAPVFVVGYMHSGTTLLHNMLAAHPSIFAAADETRFFGYLPLIAGLYPDLDDDGTLADLIVMVMDLIAHGDPARLRSAPKRYRPAGYDDAGDQIAAVIAAIGPDRRYGMVFRRVFEQLTRQAGKTRWLEKTPQHVFAIEDILRDIPDARFIEIIRDPRDILASKKKRKAAMRGKIATQADRIKALERVYEPLWESLEWRLALRAGQQAAAQFPDRLYSLRYEDLVADPERVLAGVCAFAGLDFSPRMLDVRWWNTAEGDRSQRQGVVSDAVGRWQRTLSASEVAVCQRATGAQLRRAGYAPVPVPARAWPGAAWLAVRAGFGLIDRLIRRWRLGGMPFLMNTLTNYAKELRKLIRR